MVRTSAVIDLTRLILRGSLVGKCTQAPAEDLALSTVENQSVLADCSPAFEPQLEQTVASTEVPAPHDKPLDTHLAYAFTVTAGRYYYQGLYQDSPAGCLSVPALSLFSPVPLQTNVPVALPCLEE